MNASQFCHDGSPHAFTSLFEEFCPDAEFFAHGQVLSAPGTDMHEDRQEDDAFFREAVVIFCLCLGSSVRVTIPSLSSISRRLERMLDEMPSSDWSISRKCRLPPKIMSRRIRRVQRSPKISSERLIGQRDRCTSVVNIRNQLSYCISRTKIVTDCMVQLVLEQHGTGEFDE